MNNEVLRRKLFRTVLADSRSPAGILASSPEMVETVQKRANGGTQAGSYELNLIPELVQRGDVKALQALTAPSYPKQVRLAASKALGAATVDKRPAPNFPVSLDFSRSGQPLSDEPDYLSLKDQFEARPLKDQFEARPLKDARPFGSVQVDPEVYETETSKNIMSFLGSLKGTGEVARPKTTRTQSREASGLASLLGPQFDAEDPRTEAAMAVATPGDASGIPSMLPNSPDRPSVRSPFTPGPLVEDEDIVDDEYTSMTPITPGEELSASSVSGADTGTKVGAPQPTVTGNVSSAISKAKDIVGKHNAEQSQADTSVATATNSDTLASTITKLQQDIQNPDVSETDKAKLIDEKAGIIPVGKKATRKERVEARRAMLKEILGEEKAKDMRTDANYNLIMTGLMIAAGESPDALTNIAKGAAAGLQNYAEATADKAAEERKREETIALQALQEVSDEMTKEQDREYQDKVRKETRQYESLVREDQQNHAEKLQDKNNLAALQRLGFSLDADQEKQKRDLEFKLTLSDKTFEQQVAMAEINIEQQNALLAAKQTFESQLAEYKAELPPEKLRLMEALAETTDYTMQDLVALEYGKGSGGRATDEQRRFSELVGMGMSPQNAFFWSQSGVVSALAKELGSAEAAMEQLYSSIPSNSGQQTSAAGTQQQPIKVE